MTPEERRDETVAQIINAGGTVLATEPLARPDAPHDIVAWRITAGALDTDVLTALAEVQADTEVRIRGLVPWQPEEVIEGAPIDHA